MVSLMCRNRGREIERLRWLVEKSVNADFRFSGVVRPRVPQRPQALPGENRQSIQSTSTYTTDAIAARVLVFPAHW